MNYSVCTLNCTTGVICSIDTDVIVLATYYCARMPGLTKLWIQKNDTYFPLHSIVHNYAHSLECKHNLLTGILLSVYILTGCDTVSFIFNKSKVKALKVTIQNLDKLRCLGAYGESSEIGIEEATEEACYFFKSMYGRPGFEGNLDMLCAHLFATSSDLRFLPPTEDAFKQHVLQALMQISVSISSHLSNPLYPNPTLFGREIVNGKLVPVLICKPAKSSVVKHKTVSCNCKQALPFWAANV